ncbi:MAG: hypothetical protein KKG33_02160 [candidate division Zixibacteria bacterium]|nr:hypothetical protein [candidate division Zixibacteria bacterium]MBU1469972.1 hypothetical protein [candidate division Zixibacteria bacterium]MBU2624345.1 hypothetical protein [candidate division Zixibacteria bacterium]
MSKDNMPSQFDIPYQPTASRLLKNALKSGRLHSAYLFSGAEGNGKWNAAINLAAEVLSLHWDTEIEKQACINRAHKLVHPDLHLLFPMPAPKNKTEEAELPQFFRRAKADDPFAPVEYGKVANILVDNVRALKRALYSTPTEQGYRAVIFQQVERMPETSFDILLKTIEEPPPLTLLILLTDNIRRLPATVASRCQKVRFVPVADSFIKKYLIDVKGLSSDEARQFARISGGSFSEAYRLSQSDISERRELAISLFQIFATGDKERSFSTLIESVDMRNRDEAFAIIKLWQGFLRDVLIVKENLPESFLLNSDYQAELGNIAKKYKTRDAIHKSMTELLETQKLFYRNVPPRLALTQLAWRINELCTG